LFREDDDGSSYSGIRGVLNNPITTLQRNELFEKQCDLSRQNDGFFSQR
jgi:hypothetical protein